MNIKNSLISVAVASFIIGCGSSDSDSSNPTNNPSTPNTKGIVCEDVNSNTVCEDGEKSQKVNSYNDFKGYAELKALSATQYPLAYNDEDGLVLTAPPGSDSINPWTTLVYSELKNNELVSNLTEAKTSVIDNIGQLNDDKQKDLEKLFRKVLKENNDANPNTIFAAVAKELKKNGIKDISKIEITAKNIEEAKLDDSVLTKLVSEELFSASVQEEIDKLDKAGWVDATDSSIRVLKTSGDKILAGSVYHNALTVVDVNSKKAKYNSFATIKGAGHGHLDEESGASENYLRGVEITSDNVVFANVPPKSSKSKTYDKKTFGLYKANIESDGTIDYSKAKRIEEIVSNFVVSKDGKTLIAYANDNLIVYDVSGEKFEEKASLEIENIRSFVLNDNKLYAIATGDDKTKSIHEFNISDNSLDKTDLKIDLKKDFNPNTMLVQDGELLLFQHDGHNPDTKVGEVDLKAKSIKIATIKVGADSVSISKNGKYLALVNHDEAKLFIANMKNEYKEVQQVIDIANGSRAVSFVDNSTVAYLKDRNEVGVLKIEDTKNVVSVKERLELAVNSVEKEINGGSSLDVVIKDLILTEKVNDIQFTWTSQNSAIDKTGKVTRPEVDKNDEVGNLNVIAVNEKYKDINYKKEYEVTVRKKPIMLKMPIANETGRMDYMATNNDGSVLVAPVRFKLEVNGEEQNLYGIASYTLNDEGKPVEKTAAKVYASDEQISGVGINGTNAIAVARSTKKDTYSGRIFTIAINDNKTLADKELNSIDIKTGTPLKVEYNSDQSKAAVIIKKSDDKFITEVYDISNDGKISLANTITMGDYEYKTYGPAAINEDGTKVYQRDSDAVHLYSTSGSTVSVEVENIARVWTGASRVFVHTYSGEIYSFDENLENKKSFNTGTGGRMYGGEVRKIEDKNYLFIPVQRSSQDLNGIYKLEILEDGSLKEIAFANNPFGADRMAVSKDGKVVYFNFRDDKRKYNIAAVDMRGLPTYETLKEINVENQVKFNIQKDVSAYSEEYNEMGDSRIVALSGNDKYLVSANKWHNGLSVVDLAKNETNFTPFAALKNAGHGKADATSGATESTLNQIEFINDAVYVNVPETKGGKEKVRGLYKVAISNGNFSTLENGQIKSDMKINETFDSFAIKSDASEIVAYDGANLIAYDKDFKETASSEIEVVSYLYNNDKLVVVHKEGLKVFVSSNITIKDEEFVFNKDIELDFQPTAIKTLSDGKILALEEKKQKPLNLVVVDLTSKEINKNELKEVSGTKYNYDVSKDGRFLAISNDNSIRIVSLYSKKPEVLKTIETSRTNSVDFLSNDKLAYTDGSNEMVVIDLVEGDELTKENLISMKLEKITNIEINNALPFSEVRKDLDLSINKLYDSINVSYDFSSTIAPYIKEDGTFTQPDETISGKLIVKGEVDGDMGEREIDITLIGKNQKDTVVFDDEIAINTVTIGSDKAILATNKGLRSYKVKDNTLEPVGELTMLNGIDELVTPGTWNMVQIHKLDDSTLIGLGKKFTGETIKTKGRRGDVEIKLYESKIFKATVSDDGTVNKDVEFIDVGNKDVVEIDISDDKKTMGILLTPSPKYVDDASNDGYKKQNKANAYALTYDLVENKIKTAKFELERDCENVNYTERSQCNDRYPEDLISLNKDGSKMLISEGHHGVAKLYSGSGDLFAKANMSELGLDHMPAHFIVKDKILALPLKNPQLKVIDISNNIMDSVNNIALPSDARVWAAKGILLGDVVHIPISNRYVGGNPGVIKFNLSTNELSKSEYKIYDAEIGFNDVDYLGDKVLLTGKRTNGNGTTYLNIQDKK